MSAKYDRVTVWCVFHVLFYSWLWFIISHGPWKTLSVVAFGCEHISRKSSSIRWCHFLCFWHGLEETNMNCFSTSWPEYLSRIFLQVFQTWHLWVQWPMASLTFLCLVSVLPVPGIPRLLNHILSSCAKNWHLVSQDWIGGYRRKFFSAPAMTQAVNQKAPTLLRRASLRPFGETGWLKALPSLGLMVNI